MELLASNFEPLVSENERFVEKWTELFVQSEKIDMAVGYASNDSVLYLKSLLQWNQPKKLNLCIGMALFDGIFQSQLSALMELDEFLKTRGLGGVFFSNQFPFHGKVHAFKNQTGLVGGLVGSSNLSNIVPPKGTIYRGNFEVDLFVTEPEVLANIDSLLSRLIASASIPLESALQHLKIKTDFNPLLDSRFEVKIIEIATVNAVRASLTGDTFDIPLKTTPKSNMNVFFGKGRDNNHGFIAPRPWYEVEIIPGQAVMRSSPNYPQHQEFFVYTDDNYKFVLYTGGDNNKNLRSRDDLTTIGRWLKGRLEMSGALKSGEVVDEDVFNRYGRNSVTLTRSQRSEYDPVREAILQVWFADFGVQS